MGLGYASSSTSEEESSLAMQETEKWHTAACHCGGVKFRVLLRDGLASARRCSCSYCRMRGAVAVTALLPDLEILEGEDLLTLYQFHTHTAKHYFCKVCGIYTHHQRRSAPNQYGINAACIEGVSPFDFPEVPVADGVAHPSDTGGKTGVIGMLRFDRLSQKV
jgi:hypothetical protein